MLTLAKKDSILASSRIPYHSLSDTHKFFHRYYVYIKSILILK